jgi:multiple sugar transport system ATP-binding protein
MMFLNSGGHKNFMPFKKKEEVVKAPADVKPAAKAEAKSAAKVEAKPAPKAEAPVVEKPKDLAYVSLRHVDKIYDNNVQAVFDFNLDIKKKEFIVFVGPSGCGKSTTLRMIAGLEDISHGELWIDGEYSNDRTPKDRDIAMVFQSYALYPHMTVYNNMAFGLKIRHLPKEEIDRRVHEAAKILQIEEFLDRKPKALSGGQRQRVALGRAIVRNAKVFLMDEPLSNLDAKLRVQMRSELIKLHEALENTTIYVTHDQTEAMTMASRIVVMKLGRIQQIGSPIEIYNKPNNLFVAGFIGSPSMNFLKAIYDQGTITLIAGPSSNSARPSPMLTMPSTPIR